MGGDYEKLNPYEPPQAEDGPAVPDRTRLRDLRHTIRVFVTLCLFILCWCGWTCLVVSGVWITLGDVEASYAGMSIYGVFLAAPLYASLKVSYTGYESWNELIRRIPGIVLASLIAYVVTTVAIWPLVIFLLVLF